MASKHFDDFINDLLKEIRETDRVKSSDIPNIDLYMDQVTTFMDENLGLFKRSGDDKILTKTMINNYSKYDLLPPTIRKKYTNEHIIYMLFIYYLKPILSITDIKELLTPIRHMFSEGNLPNGFKDLKDFHDRIVDSETSHFNLFETRMKETTTIAQEVFKDVQDEKKRELLSIFATSYLLTIQASAQKHMVSSLIDDYLLKYYPSGAKAKEERTKDTSKEKKTEL
jgi:hypothetical protein